MFSSNMNSIAFILPKEKPYAVGGYKVIFEYANRLVNDGYKVYILYASTLYWEQSSMFTKIKIMAYHIKMKCYRRRRTASWFNIDPKVKQLRVLTPKERFVPKCDFYVATAVQTAFYLNSYKIPNERKLYFIQDFENWNIPDSLVYDTYKYGMRNIVISKWLRKKVESCGAVATLIPNGFDFEYFKLYNDVKNRKSTEIVFMYHIEKRKGIDIAVKAFEIVKEKYPSLHINTFSAYPKPIDLPSWYDFYHLPDKNTFNEIYNHSAIYVGPSNSEGWGLTLGEAMICGCAIVCTDNDGYKEMAQHERNALIVPIDDVEHLAEAIIRLIENRELRLQLASQGHKDIQKFNWDDSYRLFRKIFQNS